MAEAKTWSGQILTEDIARIVVYGGVVDVMTDDTYTIGYIRR